MSVDVYVKCWRSGPRNIWTAACAILEGDEIAFYHFKNKSRDRALDAAQLYGDSVAKRLGYPNCVFRISHWTLDGVTFVSEGEPEVIDHTPPAFAGERRRLALQLASERDFQNAVAA